MNENKYFLYGSGRDAATRTQRRRKFPREIAPRVGPYLVRPGRSYGPLTAEQLAGYERPIIEKVTGGSVQVLLRDRPLGIGDLKALFASLKGSSEVVNYEGMSLGALHSFVRDHQQDAEAWYWLVIRLLEDGQLSSASSAMEHMLRSGVELDEERLAAINTLGDKVSAEVKAKATEQETSVPAGDTQPSEPQERPAAEAQPTETPVEAPAPVEAPTEVPVEAPAPEPVVSEPVIEPEATPPAPVAEVKPARSLPEGWKELSNKKLAELIKDVGAEMPARTDKSSLIGALDAWLKG